MGGKSGIAWTDATWNPLRGCSKVSPGCANCYALRTAYRFSGLGEPYEGLVRKLPGGLEWTGEVRVIEEHMTDPLRWTKPRMIFVNSMSDVFHDNVPDLVIARIFAVMALASMHRFQVLTKRPERMRDLLTNLMWWANVEGIAQSIHHERTGEDPSEWLAVHGPLPNVALGVTAEDQRRSDERIPLLLDTPAAVRFVSIEPMVGPVDLCGIPGPLGRFSHTFDTLGGRHIHHDDEDSVTYEIPALDWVIVGGESGPNARPLHPSWALTLRDQCLEAGVPFFFKQWGEWAPKVYTAPDMSRLVKITGLTKASREIILDAQGGHSLHDRPVNMVRVGVKAAGDELDGGTYHEFPRAWSE